MKRAGKAGDPPAVRLAPGAERELPVAGTNPREAAAAEKLRRMALKLAATRRGEAHTCWIVTSPGAGEGKTLVAANLALVLAEEEDRRVVLVDGDLRQPSVARFLAARPAAGLEAVLAGRAERDRATVTLEGRGLRVLPVVARPREEEIGALIQALPGLLRGLRERFTDIVVDTPPVGPVTDAVRLAAHADAVVLVARALRTGREELLDALETLGREKLAGVVLNAAVPNLVDRWVGGRTYGYGYGYGHGPEGEEE